MKYRIKLQTCKLFIFSDVEFFNFRFEDNPEGSTKHVDIKYRLVHHPSTEYIYFCMI